MIFESQRPFQIWEYRVGHQQMLLRSPGAEGDDANLDVVLRGVDHIDLPHRLDGLAISYASENLADRIRQRRGSDLRHRTVYCIESGGRCYTIVAASLTILSNHLEPFESSLESFTIDPSRSNRGEVIVHAGRAPSGVGLCQGQSGPGCHACLR